MTANDAARSLARQPDRSIDDKFERVVAERDDLAGALVEAERERDKAEADLTRERTRSAQMSRELAEARAALLATREMANDANARLRALLLTALGREDDGTTALTQYVMELIADRNGWRKAANTPGGA